MRKPPVFAVEKQKLRQCLCLWRKHKSDGKKQENVLKNKNINVVMITGDNEKTAEIVAKQIGIDKINSVFFWKYVA